MKQIHRRPHRGVATLWVVVTLGFGVGLIGIAMDTGYVLVTAHRLQNAADAAALAAASKARGDQGEGRQVAIAVAGANTAGGEAVLLASNDSNAPGGDIVFGRFDRHSRTFTPGAASPNAVKVTVRRTDNSPGGRLQTVFGPIFGVNGVNISRSAIAMIGGSSEAGVIVLDESESSAMLMSGNPTLVVNGGDVQVNSSSDTALQANGRPTLVVSQINVHGDVSLGGAHFDGVLRIGASVMEDPLGSMAAASGLGRPNRGAVSIVNGTAYLLPGFYPGGIRATGGDITLAPGVYVLDGVGFDVRGNADLTAEGVLLYVTGNGEFDLGGTGTVVISAPDPAEHAFADAEVYEGISVFQDRANSNEARLRGTTLMDLNGTFYFPSAHCDVAGSSDSFGSQLIVKTLTVAGNGEININYDGRFPAPGTRVFLVE